MLVVKCHDKCNFCHKLCDFIDCWYRVSDVKQKGCPVICMFSHSVFLKFYAKFEKVFKQNIVHTNVVDDFFRDEKKMIKYQTTIAYYWTTYTCLG